MDFEEDVAHSERLWVPHYFFKNFLARFRCVLYTPDQPRVFELSDRLFQPDLRQFLVFLCVKRYLTSLSGRRHLALLGGVERRGGHYRLAIGELSLRILSFFALERPFVAKGIIHLVDEPV